RSLTIGVGAFGRRTEPSCGSAERGARMPPGPLLPDPPAPLFRPPDPSHGRTIACPSRGTCARAPWASAHRPTPALGTRVLVPLSHECPAAHTVRPHLSRSSVTSQQQLPRPPPPASRRSAEHDDGTVLAGGTGRGRAPLPRANGVAELRL